MRRFVLRGHYCTGPYDGNLLQYIGCFLGFHTWWLNGAPPDAFEGKFLSKKYLHSSFRCIRCGIGLRLKEKQEPPIPKRDFIWTARREVRFMKKFKMKEIGLLGRFVPSALEPKPNNIFVRWFFQWFSEIPKEALKDANGIWYNPKLPRW